MAKLGGYLLLTLAVLVLGGTAYLAIWDIPPPVSRVEHILPDTQFPR